MSSSNWRADYLEMQKLLKQLNAYVECHDWKSARKISKILQFKVQFCSLYEEEKIKNMRVNSMRKEGVSCGETNEP